MAGAAWSAGQRAGRGWGISREEDVARVHSWVDGADLRLL